MHCTAMHGTVAKVVVQGADVREVQLVTSAQATAGQTWLLELAEHCPHAPIELKVIATTATTAATATI